MCTQRLSYCLLAAGKLWHILLLNLGRHANANTSCAARSFRFSPFHKSFPVWYAGSAAHASLSAAAPSLLLQSFHALRIFRLEVAFCVLLCKLNLRTHFNYRFAQGSLKKASLKTSGLFLSSFLVRTLPPQFVFGVCVRSVPSNRKPFSQPQFPVLFPSLNLMEKKTLSFGQRRLRRLLELDTSAIEWPLERSKSFPQSCDKYDEGYRCIIDRHQR